MKVRIEIGEQNEDEIVIRCRQFTDEIQHLQRMLQESRHPTELSLTLGESEYFVPIQSLLFFETDGAGRLAAHTAKQMFYTDLSLRSLEQLLPRTFMRVSKSCILNSAQVSSMTRSVTGSGTVHFAGSEKIAYVSRMYYKALGALIYETRLSK